MTPQQAEQVNQSLDDTATRRTLRTLLQLIAAGGFTALVTQISKDVPDSYAPYILLVSALIVTLAQNLLENYGVIPPVLKTKANVKQAQE